MTYSSIGVAVKQSLSEPDLARLADVGLANQAAAITTLATNITTTQTDATAAQTASDAMVAQAVTVAAAVATLVADGASPTQAHVTALNTAWGTLNTDIGTTDTAVDLVVTDATALSTTPVSAAVAGDVVVFVNPATVLTRSLLKRILDHIVQLANGGFAGLTP